MNLILSLIITTMTFLPPTFTPPATLTHPDFIARKLAARDVDLDYAAVMSSLEIIRKTRGGSWPTADLTHEDDWIDLAWHQREFENGSSFAYTVMNPEQTECLGCFYLYPPGFRMEAPAGADVDVSFWVTQKAYDAGLYPVLHQALKDWLAAEWPFKQPFWSNAELPA